MDLREMEKALELKKLQLSISRAENAKLELDMKIDERIIDIERMKEHLKLQDKVIEDSKNKIKELTQ